MIEGLPSPFCSMLMMEKENEPPSRIPHMHPREVLSYRRPCTRELLPGIRLHTSSKSPLTRRDVATPEAGAIHLLRTALAFLLFARAVGIHSDERCRVIPVAHTDETDKGRRCCEAAAHRLAK